MADSFFSVEHVAWQVAEPKAVATWYQEQLGFKIVRKLDGADTHFLADAAGRVVVEVYYNPNASLPNYASMHPLLLHLAFAVDDPATARDRLVAAGATIVDDLNTTSNGDQLGMLRDPWGFAIQLAKRTEPFIDPKG